MNIPLKKAKAAKQTPIDMAMYYVDEEKIQFIKPKDSLIKVLILDNDTLWQKALKLMLEDAYNCSIEQVETLKAANSVINKPFDIIFMDVGSTEGDFLQFVEKYRKRCKAAPPPIIITTACASDEQRELINGAEVTDILAKPVDYYSLVEMVNYYVFQKHPETE